MLEGLGHVSDLIARFAWVETLYLHASTPKRVQLQDALIGLYTAVLQYLAKARRYYAKHTHGDTSPSLTLQYGIAKHTPRKDPQKHCSDQGTKCAEVS